MHRWSFQRLIRWLVPTLVYGVALCALILEHKRPGEPGGLDFISDSTYRTLAVARSLGERFRYDFQPGAPTLALRDTLPRTGTALVGRVLNNYPAALVLLGALLGGVVVLMTLRMARRLFPFPPFVLYTAILLIISAGFLPAAIGESAVWCMALLSIALVLHIEGLAGYRNMLDRSVVLCLGLLSLVRVEFILVWIVLVLHALGVGLLERRRDGAVGYAAVRMFTGLFMLSLFVAPLVSLNLHTVRVPWPQSPGAPLTADALAAMSPGAAVLAYRTHMAEGIRRAFRALNDIPWMQNPIERILTWLGAAFLAGLAFFRKDERLFSAIPWLFLSMPVALGVAYPFTGSAGYEVPLSALQPLCVLAASFLIFRIPFLLESIYRKFRPGLPEAPGFQVWWALAGGVLVLAALFHTTGWTTDHVRALARARAERAHARNAIARSLKPGTALATDIAGWWTYTFEWPLVDLAGEGTPDVLSCLDRQGHYDGKLLKDFLREKNVTMVLLQDSALVPTDEDYVAIPLASASMTDEFSWRLYELKPPGAL